MADAATKSIRFGLMVDGDSLHDWQVHCLNQLFALDFVELSLVIKTGKTGLTAPFFNQIFFRYYERLIRRKGALYSHPIEQTSPYQHIANTTQIECHPARKSSHAFELAAAYGQSIREYDLDFILRFGSGTVRGEVVQAARFGVWQFHPGDVHNYRGEPAGFWEIFRGELVTGAGLLRLTDRLDASVILRRGFFKTLLHNRAKTLNQVLYQIAIWPSQVCQDIRMGQTAYLDQAPEEYHGRIYHIPTNWQMMRYTGISLGHKIRQLRHRLTDHDLWNVGLVRQPIHRFLDDTFVPDIEWLPLENRHTFLADPFGLIADETPVIIFEELDYHDGKGFFSAVRVEKDGTFSPREKVFEHAVHLSYPYLFRYQEKTYAIPETYHANKIGLYRLDDFPRQWVKVKTLVETDGIDSTIFQHNNRWWLMFTRADTDHNLCLYIWHAAELMGDWQPHPLNPVKMDVRTSRPGGTPFVHEGRLYRPVQDCSGTYGGRIGLTRVDVLTETDFQETLIRYVEQPPGSPFPDGLHTLSAVGDYTVLDGKQITFSWMEFRRQMGRYVGMLISIFKR